MTRRQAIKTTALASAALASLPGAIAQPLLPTGLKQPLITTAGSGAFTLPPLPYDYDALEPHIDAQTMQIHHDKHHATYIANLNKAITEFPDLGNKPVEDLLKDLNSVPEKIRTAVRNNGGGHYNHTLFWQMMKKTAAANRRANWPRRLTLRSEVSPRSRKIFPRPRWDNSAAAGPGWFWTARN